MMTQDVMLDEVKRFTAEILSLCSTRQPGVALNALINAWAFIATNYLAIRPESSENILALLAKISTAMADPDQRAHHWPILPNTALPKAGPDAMQAYTRAVGDYSRAIAALIREDPGARVIILSGLADLLGFLVADPGERGSTLQ